MDLRRFCDCWKLVHNHGSCRRSRARSLRFGYRFYDSLTIPLTIVIAPLLGDDACLVTERLLLDVAQGFADGGLHVPGLGQANQWSDS